MKQTGPRISYELEIEVSFVSLEKNRRSDTPLSDTDRSVPGASQSVPNKRPKGAPDRPRHAPERPRSTAEQSRSHSTPRQPLRHFRKPQTPPKRSLVEIDRKIVKLGSLGLGSAMILAHLRIPEFWYPVSTC